MTKADMVDIISGGTGLTKVETEAVIDAFLTTLAESMVDGRRVEFRKFGSFGVRNELLNKPGILEPVRLSIYQHATYLCLSPLACSEIVSMCHSWPENSKILLR